MAPSKQLRDMVLDIVKKNKDIGFDDIIVQMKKMVGIRGDSLIKLVDEILKWWEEGGKILQLVDRKTRMGIYRMNENTKIAKDIIDEALSELGISKTSEESLTEAINPRTIDPKGWYGIYIHERLKQKHIVGPYPSEKEAYHDYGGDWDNIFMGAELIKRLNKGEYKDFTLKAMTESDNITEARGYRKVKDLDRTKSLWELRTLYGMSYLVVSYSPQVDETAVFKADKNGKILSYSEVYSTKGREEPEQIIRDIASGKIKPMNENVVEGAKEIHKKLMQKGVVAPIDTTRHPKRKGLEGPFRSRKSGKVFYYDPKEGKYYDADSDIYLDVDDIMEENIVESTRYFVYLDIEGSNPKASFEKIAKMFSSLSSWEEADYKGNNKAIITFNAQKHDSKERMKVAEFIKRVKGVKFSHAIEEEKAGATGMIGESIESTLDENRYPPEQMIKAFYKMHPNLKLNGVSENELKKLADKAMKEGGGWNAKSFHLLANFLYKAGATGMFSGGRFRESIDESATEKSLLGKVKSIMKENIVEAWTADSVSRNADIGSDKGYGINIRKGGGITKAPYKHMLMMRTSGKKIKVRFDFGKDEFVGTPQEVADHINEILGIK